MVLPCFFSKHSLCTIVQTQSYRTHQPLVSKGVVHTPDEEPEWPEVLKPEVQYKVCQQHQCPHHQELQVQKGTEDKHKSKIITTWYY